jgi:hypothetical protein
VWMFTFWYFMSPPAFTYVSLSALAVERINLPNVIFKDLLSLLISHKVLFMMRHSLNEKSTCGMGDNRVEDIHFQQKIYLVKIDGSRLAFGRRESWGYRTGR